VRKLLKEGHIATIYREQDYVYKVYDPLYPEEWIDKEIYIHNLIRKETDLTVLTLEKKNAHTIKMPFLAAPSLETTLFNNPYDPAWHVFTELQNQIHQYEGFDLEPAHLVFKRRLELSWLSDEIREIALAILAKLPVQTQLCHFDFQPSHVIQTENKLTILDWLHAKQGHPMMDIANTYVLLRLQNSDVALHYLQGICEMTDYQSNMIYSIIPLMAALQLLETDDIYKHKVLTTLIYDPENTKVTLMET